MTTAKGLDRHFRLLPARLRHATAESYHDPIGSAAFFTTCIKRDVSPFAVALMRGYRPRPELWLRGPEADALHFRNRLEQFCGERE